MPQPADVDQDMAATVVSSSQDEVPATQQTQQQTQPTQQAALPEYIENPNIWGRLDPFDHNLSQIVFERWKRRYVVGRIKDPGGSNDIILDGNSITGRSHCLIEWDGVEGPSASVKVTDTSSNGTYINRVIIGPNRSYGLRDGNEIAFGTWEAQGTTSGNEQREFRYIYRHVAYTRPDHGLHKDYDVQTELGRGTFAVVMKGLHREEGNYYAVKIIEAKKLKHDWSYAVLGGSNLDDISREITILKRLEHRNICQMKEFFVDSHGLSLVLEWVPGGDLLSYLLKNFNETCLISEELAQYFTYQMCDALAYIHRQGIAHRDLKPENVLLTNDNPPIVKVADFGLAKAIDGQTMLRTMCGTPVYLAPEVVTQGPEGYDLLVDSWSVGVIVFSMLTMSIPFDEDSQVEVTQRVANRYVRWDILHERAISEDGEDFVRGLLENDPTRRTTMAEACMHQWLTMQAMRKLAPRRPRSNAPLASATSSIPVDSIVAPDNAMFYRTEKQDSGSIPGLPRPKEVLVHEGLVTVGPPTPTNKPATMDGNGDVVPVRAKKRKIDEDSSVDSMESIYNASGRSVDDHLGPSIVPEGGLDGRTVAAPAKKMRIGAAASSAGST
ncbi:kinase-like domain-containing protein [Trametes meyenii]|nr:kinase-like domain-containing protein [Trametes meyenii]